MMKQFFSRPVAALLLLFGAPWMAAAQRYGVKHVMIRERPDGRIFPEDLFAAVTPRTRLIALSHSGVTVI